MPKQISPKQFDSRAGRRLIIISGCLLFLAAMTSCGPSDADTKFIRQLERTKAEIKASEVRALMIQWFSNKTGRIPEKLRTLPILSEGADDISALSDRSGTNFMELSVGGGFARQGIVVCLTDSPSNQKELHALKGTVIPWEQGVYFWADWWVRGVPRRYWNR